MTEPTRTPNRPGESSSRWKREAIRLALGDDLTWDQCADRLATYWLYAHEHRAEKVQPIDTAGEGLVELHALLQLADEAYKSQPPLGPIVGYWLKTRAGALRVHTSAASARDARLKAETAALAWDEGYHQGVRDNEGDLDRADNPYATEGADHA